MKRVPLLFIGIPVCCLAACSSTGVTDSHDLDGPVHGSADDTRFVAGTDGNPVDLGNLAAVAKTIRKYKNLGASDQEIIRRVASLKLDGMVASQMQVLAPQFEKKKVAVRKNTQARIAVVRKAAAVAQKPPAVVEQEVAVVQAEEVKEIQQIDLDWKATARAEVIRNYGTDFAVPVQNSEGKAVVAFASMKETEISVSAASYELAGTSDQLVAAASTGRQISHEGRAYALLDSPAALR